MFHDALRKLKEKMLHEEPAPEKEELVSPAPDTQPADIEEDEEEPIDILSFVEKHGVVNKDKPSSKEHNRKRLNNPVIKRKPKPQPQNDIDLEIFEEEHDAEAGALEILEYLDSHGIETKSADSDIDRFLGEEDLVRSRKATEKVIDLHGLRSREAELKIRLVFRDAKKRGYQQVLIIHGRGNHSTGGDPILKRMVVDLLEGPLESQVASFFFAPLNEGGGGATRVILR